MTDAKHIKALPAERPPLELIAFAAWVNVSPDKIPPEMRGPTCAATMAAWKRVADAIVAHANAQSFDLIKAYTSDIERKAKRNRELAMSIEPARAALEKQP